MYFKKAINLLNDRPAIAFHNDLAYLILHYAGYSYALGGREK